MSADVFATALRSALGPLLRLGLAVAVTVAFATPAAAQTPSPLDATHWTASVGYGARTHLTARASGPLADLVTLGHTYGPTLRLSAAYHSRAGWVYTASFDDGRSNRAYDEVVELFAEALAAYPGRFFPDFSSSAYAFQPDIADRYGLGIGRDFPIGRWSFTPQLTAGVLDIRLADVGQAFKQRDANAIYDIRLRPSARRLLTPVIGAGTEIDSPRWRNLGLRFSAQFSYARPRYTYALVARELVSGREDASAPTEAGAWLVGQITAGLFYRLPLP